MAFTEIPSEQEFKKACGRTGIRAKFKRKNDLGPIFTALSQAAPFRTRRDVPAIAPLRAVRKACCQWIGVNQSVARASGPKVKDLCAIVSSTITGIVESTYGGVRLALPAKPTLKDVGKRVMDMRGGAVGDVGRTLEESYWIEKALPGHLGKGAVAAAFGEWKNLHGTKLNFDNWLKHIYVPECQDDEFGSYLMNRKGGLAAKIEAKRKNDAGRELTGVEYCTEEERDAYVISIQNGSVVDLGGDTYDTGEESTVFSGKGWAIFVMAPDGTLYANSHVADRFHHSSFLAGGPIKCAGEIEVKEGVITSVTPKTGHYKAGAAELEYFLQFCRDKGVRLQDVRVCAKPFDSDKKWYPGDAVLLAKGEEPTAQHIKDAEALRRMPPKPTRPVPQPPGKGAVQPGNVKNLINKWENIGKRPGQQ
jgi:hypothetical protein